MATHKGNAAVGAEVLGLTLNNPLVVGSGLLTDQERNIRNLLSGGAGAVVTKTIHPSPPTGTDERIVRLPTGMLNSTTYSRRPVSYWLDRLRSFAGDGLPVIASIHADTPIALGELAGLVSQTGCRALELGISCLNEADGLHDTPERVYAYVSAARQRSSLPMAVKLAVGEGLLARAQAAAEAGGDAVTVSDTIPGAAVVSAEGHLALGGVYGYSGPGIKPLVIAAIVELRRQGFRLPILGCGGVCDGRDVVDYLSVGATAAQVYTALHTDMFVTLRRILDETSELLHSSGPAVGGRLAKAGQR